VDYYVDSDLAELLPVVPDESSEPVRRSVYNRPFRLRVTAEGAASPVLQFMQDPQENLLFIERQRPGQPSLPSFYWYSDRSLAKPTATVLATHDADLIEGDPAGRKRPIFVLGQAGKGKVFWSATDETWRWRRRIGDRYFYRFWGQVIRSLAQGKLLGGSKRVSLYTDRPTYTYRDPVELTCEVLKADFSPVDLEDVPSVEIRLAGPDGTEKILTLEPDWVATGGARKGLYTAVLIPEITGSYTATFFGPPVVDLGDGPPPETHFQVREPALEMKDPFMNEAGLRALAESTGSGRYPGRFLLPHELDELTAPGGLPEQHRVHPSQDSPPIRLWTPERSRYLLALLLVFVALLTVEWIGRKLVRLL